MLHIVIATRNSHKVRELTQLLRTPGIRWHSLTEFLNAPKIDEDGKTFEENAVKKARAIANATGYFALADDSGIEVDALNGKPGIYSARFAGAHGNDRANNEKLLRLLDGLPPARRSARYVCSLALVAPRQVVAVTCGIWTGRIAEAARGDRGFGYDPVFLVPRHRKTVAQLPVETKQRLSHRAKAAQRMRLILSQLVKMGEISGPRRGDSAGSRLRRA